MVRRPPAPIGDDRPIGRGFHVASRRQLHPLVVWVLDELPVNSPRIPRCRNFLPSSPILAHVVEREDVGMREPRDRLRLSLEALADFFALRNASNGRVQRRCGAQGSNVDCNSLFGGGCFDLLRSAITPYLCSGYRSALNLLAGIACCPRGG